MPASRGFVLRWLSDAGSLHQAGLLRRAGTRNPSRFRPFIRCRGKGSVRPTADLLPALSGRAASQVPCEAASESRSDFVQAFISITASTQSSMSSFGFVFLQSLPQAAVSYAQARASVEGDKLRASRRWPPLMSASCPAGPLALRDLKAGALPRMCAGSHRLAGKTCLITSASHLVSTAIT
jgi:hypothetical protein